MNRSLAPQIVLVAIAGATACVDSGGGGSVVPEDSEFDFVGMMANYVDNVILPAYQRFAASTAAISSPTGPVASYCGSIGTVDEAVMLDSAREAWRTGMSDWQEAEAYLVGPATANGGAIRNSIYSFFSGSPLSTCAIDQAVVLNQDLAFDINSRSFNQRGLDALEYLFFNDDLMHTCPVQIVETVDWDLRPETERKQLRCEYALELATDLDQSVTCLLYTSDAADE